MKPIVLGAKKETALRKVFAAILTAMLSVLVPTALTSCHETIHIHPHPVSEKVTLTLIIDNDAPQPGAVVDYTITPPVIIYSDEVAATHHNRAGEISPQRAAEIAAAEARSRQLIDRFDEIAPYEPDGRAWDILLRYEIYDKEASQVPDAEPVYANAILIPADTRRPRHDVELELPYGVVCVVASAQYVPKGSVNDYFFLTDPIHTLTCDMDLRQGQEDKFYRDCFCVSQQFHIEPTETDGAEQHYEATLKRPQGRFMFLADDYETYLKIAGVSLDDTQSHLHYPAYVNVAYSLLQGIPTSSGYDFGFEATPRLFTVDAAPYVDLGHDWSIVNVGESTLPIALTIYDDHINNPINAHDGVQVPVFKDKVTLAVGHWLTERGQGGGGGFRVDPSFTDEIVIHF